MTHTEQAIKEAAEKGGYDDSAVHLVLDAMTQYDYDATVNLIVLDPLFWQALGKARGWQDDYHTTGWRRNWHHFIDHLAQGNDAESFFAQLV